MPLLRRSFVGIKKGLEVDVWTAIGCLLLGAAIGALLTRIVSREKIRRVKAEIAKRERDTNRPAA